MNHEVYETIDISFKKAKTKRTLELSTFSTSKNHSASTYSLMARRKWTKEKIFVYIKKKLSNVFCVAHITNLQPRIAMNEAKHKIANLLKI